LQKRIEVLKKRIDLLKDCKSGNCQKYETQNGEEVLRQAEIKEEKTCFLFWCW